MAGLGALVGECPYTAHQDNEHLVDQKRFSGSPHIGLVLASEQGNIVGIGRDLLCKTGWKTPSEGEGSNSDRQGDSEVVTECRLLEPAVKVWC